MKKISLPILRGFSGTPTSISDCQAIINKSIELGFNAYRIAFNPRWVSGTRPYSPEYVDYFLDNWDGYIIIDRNHHLQDTMNWTQAEADIFECLGRWGIKEGEDYTLEELEKRKRALFEIVNEYSQNDLWTRCQTIIDNVRSAGYQNIFVQNRHWGTTWVKLNDPLYDVYGGKHFYMNNYTPDSWQGYMIGCINVGYENIVNTEVGAHFSESGSFTTENVAELSDFLQWCADRNIGNMIWMNKNLNNLNRYETLGLVLPTYQELEPDPVDTSWHGVGLDYGTIGIDDYIKIDTYNFDTVRLVMAFVSGQEHTLYDPVRLDNVLDALEVIGVKAGLDLHNWQDHAGYFGSQEWIDKWVEIATRYKDDDRVVFLEIFNEPFPSTWHSSITGDGGGIYDNSDGVREALVRCTTAIRNAGWMKAVIWPSPWYWNTMARVWDPSSLVGTEHYGEVAIAFHEWYKSTETIDSRMNRVNIWKHHYPVWNGEINKWHPGDGSMNADITQWTYDMTEFFYINDDGFSLWLHGRTSRDEAWQYSEEVLQYIGFIGGVSVSVTYENRDSETQTLQVGKDETVVKFVPRETITVPAGETVDITVQDGERIVRPEQ